MLACREGFDGWLTFKENNSAFVCILNILMKPKDVHTANVDTPLVVDSFILQSFILPISDELCIVYK
jgi:hypothetical protein